MFGLAPWHWVIVAVVIFLLFGRGAIPGFAKDVADGIKNFKTGMKEIDDVNSTTKTKLD